MTSFHDFLEKRLEDLDFKIEFDALEPEFSIIQAIINVRNSGMTQEELAEKTGLTQRDISRFENGNANPSLKTLKRLAEGMGMTLKLEFVPGTIKEGKMGINAMGINRYKNVQRGWWKSFAAGEKTAPLIIRLAEILDQMEPQGDDNLHTIWVTARRPTFRQFYDRNYGFDEPYKEASAETIESAKDEYSYYYPLPKVWYQLSVKHFARTPEEAFYALFVDNSCVFTINDCNRHEVYDGTDLLEWAIRESEAFVAHVRNGTYVENVLERIPYIYREGKIKRRDLWDADPKEKKDFFKSYRKRAIKKFYAYFKSDRPEMALLPEMTARKYYEACAVVYHALGIHRETVDYNYKETEAERERYGGATQTPKEMYYSRADGRDNGLKNVPMDDPLAFEEWESEKGPYYDFNGSHPWEIIPSFSTSFSMHLYPWKKENAGYFFALSGESALRAPETIIAAKALYEAGYPVKVYGIDKIIDRIEGNDSISVVPISEWYPFDESIHLPEGITGRAVAEKTDWKFDNYKMKSS